MIKKKKLYGNKWHLYNELVVEVNTSGVCLS